MIKDLKSSNLLLFTAILIVFISNLFQGGITELLADEAYYWVYKEHLDWGFFDHPPMVAVWIYLSELFFSGELGVRFFSSISYSLTLWFIWKSIDHPKKEAYTWLFLVVFLSSALLSVYGFITTPDTPLMLFYSIFIYGYQQYLKYKNLWSYILLTISIAGMMYSKYQGLLIVFFVIISNLKLLRDPRLWFTSIMALVLYLPHLYWQWDNDFPSLKFHLVERGNRVYKFEYTLLHFVNILVIVGITFPIIYKAFFSYQKTKDPFFRALNFIIWGFIIFFFLATFKGHVQAQWVLAIAIPFVILTFSFLVNHEKSRRWFVYLACINFLFMVAGRVQLAWPVLPIKMETHGNQKWANEVKETTNGLKKVFINSYRHTANYWFYTKEPAHYFRNYKGRHNHFELLQKNTDLSFSKIALIHDRSKESDDEIIVPLRENDSTYTKLISNFKDLSHIKVSILEEDLIFKTEGKNQIRVRIESSFERKIPMDELGIVVGFMSLTKRERYMVKAEIIGAVGTLQKNQAIGLVVQFDGSEIKEPELYALVAIGFHPSKRIDEIRASSHHSYTLDD